MPGGIPGNLRFAKVYYIPDLEAIKAEEENAKTLGEGAADEWRKGLATQGKDAMADCARWEQWELNMRPGADLSQVLREYDISSFPRYLGETHGRSAGLSTGQFQPAIVANGKQHFLLQLQLVRLLLERPLPLSSHSCCVRDGYEGRKHRLHELGLI